MTLRIYFWRIDFYIIWNLTSSPSSKWGKFTIFHFIEMFETDDSKRRSRDMMESVFPQSNSHPGSKGRRRPQTMKTAKTNTLVYHWDQKERSRISSQSLKMYMLLFWYLLGEDKLQGVFFNCPPPPEFAKCWPVSNWFQKNVRVPDWPPLWLWSENA